VINIPKRVLVFAAHQDDEAIGCGGTIKKWSTQGSEIHVCFVTDGSTGVEQGSNTIDIEKTRMEEAEWAAAALGVHKLHNFGLECQKVSNKKANFHKFIQKIREVKPDLVLTHNQVCKHRDHKRTSLLVEEACWKADENILEELGPPHRVKDLWSFEILDPHPNPDFVVDITHTYTYKMAAMDIYLSQHGILNDIRKYLDGITKVRGYSIGVGRGEAFTRIGRNPVKL
jgi:LmbE family N-acetylglucosaminyl deacetylase